MSQNDDAHLVWEDLQSEILIESPIFALRTVHRRSPDGRTAPFIALDAPQWVTVIPELQDGAAKEFLLVRQFRHGTGEVGLEFPAGVVDEGEDAATAAARELLEETGHVAESLVSIGAVSPNPAFMTNTTHTFLAKGLKKIADLNLDENELLDVQQMGFEQLSQEIGQGPFASAITVQAWYFYLSHSGLLK